MHAHGKQDIISVNRDSLGSISTSSAQLVDLDMADGMAAVGSANDYVNSSNFCFVDEQKANSSSCVDTCTRKKFQASSYDEIKSFMCGYSEPPKGLGTRDTFNDGFTGDNLLGLAGKVQQ